MSLTLKTLLLAALCAFITIITSPDSGSAGQNSQFIPIKSKAEFVKAIEKKVLRRRFVELRVSTNGTINGKAAFKSVTGLWDWDMAPSNNFHFCRSLNWGNTKSWERSCQVVLIDSQLNRIRFMSESGKYADFDIE
jgi:hypothetical protein